MNSGITNKVHTAREKVMKQAWIERATRLGFVVRGLIYIFAGILGIKLALAGSGGFSGLVEVLGKIREQPFGQVILFITILGLVGYSFWGWLRGVFNILEKENNLSGFIARFGFLISAISTGSLAWTAWTLLKGAALPTSGPQKISERALAIPGGRELLIIVGIFWVAGCFGQMVLAAKSKFKEDLIIGRVDNFKKKGTMLSGKIGLFARSLLFGLVGLFLIYSALISDPSKALDFGQLLNFLDTLIFGPLIVGVLSLGLIMFGSFSIMQSKYIDYPKFN